MLADTHTHLYSGGFGQDREALIREAISSGISRFYLPNIDASSIEAMLEIERSFPGNCFAMMGVHPCSINVGYKTELEIARTWLDKRKFAGIGEIGMDLYWDKTFVAEQAEALLTQLNWAVEFDYAVSMHCREAFDNVCDVIESMPVRPRGVFHCFTGTIEQAERALSIGNFKLGIGGVVTFKNAGLDKVLEHIKLEDLVLETDAPYLAPAPFRGKTNKPVYLLAIRDRVAAIKKVSAAEVEEVTGSNTLALFGKI